MVLCDLRNWRLCNYVQKILLTIFACIQTPQGDGIIQKRKLKENNVQDVNHCVEDTNNDYDHSEQPQGMTG